MPIDNPIHGPFGSEVPGEIPDLTQAAQRRTVPTEAVVVPLNDESMRSTPQFAAAAAAREQNMLREQATAWDSIGAAVTQWTHMRILDRAARPDFEGENREGWSLHEFKQNLPAQLTEDEREYIDGIAKGPESGKYAWEQVQAQRKAKEAIGDNPVVGTATMFLDPLWLAMPPALRLGQAVRGGRAISAAGMAGVTGAMTAAQEGPVADTEIAAAMVMAAGAGALFYKAPGSTAPPQSALAAEVAQATEAVAQAVEQPAKPRYRRTQPEVWQEVEVPATAAEPARTERVKVRDAVWEEVPPVLDKKVSQVSPPEEVAAAAVADLEQQSKVNGFGQRIAWNMHKTMQGFGDVGKRIADVLLDNNGNLGKHSVESHREAIHAEFVRPLNKYYDALRASMAAEGAGAMRRIMNPSEAHAVQRRIEEQVARELNRREQFLRNGMEPPESPAPKHIQELADAAGEFHSKVLAEQKRSGVEGAAEIAGNAGYFHRQWDSASMESVISRMEAAGLAREAAVKQLHNLVGLAIQRANGFDKVVANQLGSAIVDRALRRGRFEDSAFNSAADANTMAQLRDVLKSSNVPPADIERALNVLRVQTDEAGKPGYLKYRLDLDYDTSIRIGDETINVQDLIDSRVGTLMDTYAKSAATSSAFARLGLKKPSDIANMRAELIENTPARQRKEAAELFDNIIAHYRGQPAGGEVPEAFRTLSAFTRSVALPYSGLWQLTEYSNAMAKYGVINTVKYAMQELPGFRALLKPDAETANSLNVVLAEHSVQSMRLRPFVTRHEDGFDMDIGSRAALRMQQLQQYVPYANAMKMVHHHQAKMVGNLVLDVIRKATDGDKGAASMLGRYGIGLHVLEGLKAEVRKHGFQVDKWSDDVWGNTRPAFAKMMDESVLRSRLGDMPAFAAFSPLGKFIFTYRSFTLAAHNKVLAGTVMREGAGAMGLLMMYQVPLATAAVAAQATLRGDSLNTEELALRGIGQAGGMGLFSELFRVVSGESNSFGSPGLIAVDRAYKGLKAASNLDLQAGAGVAMTVIPVVSANPFIRALEAQVK